MTRSALKRRLIAGFLLFCYLPSCTKWGPPPQTGVTPSQAVTDNPNKPIRLTLSDGRKVDVGTASVVGDSIRGVLVHDMPPASPLAGATVGDSLKTRDTVTVATADVRAVQVRRGNPVGTVGLVVGVVVATGIVVWTAAYLSECAGTNAIGCP